MHEDETVKLRSFVFFVDLERISHVDLVFLLLASNI